MHATTLAQDAVSAAGWGRCGSSRSEPLLPQRRIELCIAWDCQALRFIVVAADLDQGDAAAAFAEGDHLFLPLFVVVDINVVVADAGAVEVPQGSHGIATPVGAVDHHSF